MNISVALFIYILYPIRQSNLKSDDNTGVSLNELKLVALLDMSGLAL